MNDKQRIEKFYAKAEKCGGFKQVPAERIYSIFEEIVDLSASGFAKAKRGTLARKVDENIAHVIKLQALKGATYGLAYGISLSYLPYPYAPTVKWHRTLKSASLDLFEQPQEHMRGVGMEDEAEYTPTSMLGEVCFREELSSLWKRISPGVQRWFDATRTLDQVLRRSDEQVAWKWRGPRHAPDARLVKAFTLAKMGRSGEGHAELDQFLREQRESEEARKNLEEALEEISCPSRLQTSEELS